MSIYTSSSLSNVLKNYDANKWTESADFKVGTKLESTNILKLPEESSTKTSFGEFLANSIIKVNQLQNNANEAINKLATGETENLHETMILVEQADLAFKTMNQVRTKVLDAYKEIMRMQV